MSLDLPIRDALRQTSSHVCDFSRGYWSAIAQERAARLPCFVITVPELYVDDLRGLLSTSQVTTSNETRNRYGVNFVDLTVERVVIRKGSYPWVDA